VLKIHPSREDCIEKGSETRVITTNNERRLQSRIVIFRVVQMSIKYSRNMNIFRLYFILICNDNIRMSIVVMVLKFQKITTYVASYDMTHINNHGHLNFQSDVVNEAFAATILF
jgi:hypothetical protein